MLITPSSSTSPLSENNSPVTPKVPGEIATPRNTGALAGLPNTLGRCQSIRPECELRPAMADQTSQC
ncbi:hypothetical protein quinque_012095 [Culex quinquefasciatus]